MNIDIMENLSNNELIELCNEVYDWDHGDGIVKDGTKLREYFDSHAKDYRSMNDLADDIIWESEKRYSKIVKELMIKRPFQFIAR